MKRLIILTFAAVVVGAIATGAALGKGASEASIVGPGLDGQITLAGEGQPGGEVLMQIAEATGFFPAVFAQVPDPMLDERPEGTLGPEYTVTYVMPGPNDALDEIVQKLYPYASPSPVSYVKPGQPFWTTEKTRGGWYVAFSDAKDRLVAAGLPPNAPTTQPPSDSPWTIVGPVVVLVLVAALGGLAAFLIRRRPQPA